METIGIEYKDSESELLELWAQTAKNCSWFWTFENYVFISDRPKTLKFDEQWRLHSEISPAYEYMDGWCGYYIHGVHFEKELWQSIVSKTIKAKDAIQLQNQEQRTIALQYLGFEKLKEECNAVKRSEDEYGELWELGIKDLNGNKYVYYRAIDPSKNEYIYLRTHPDTKTPKDAMTEAYRLGQFKLVYQPTLRT